MPTPIGHALAGLAVAGVSRSARQPANAHLGVLVFCATAPDLDLLLRFVDGANHHRGPSHSLGAALLLVLAGYLLRSIRLPVPHPWAMGAAWVSHVLLDYLGLDTTPPIGEMALWPLSRDFFASPVPVFYDVPRAFTAAAIRHNALAVMIELLILGPVVALIWRRPRRRDSGSTGAAC